MFTLKRVIDGGSPALRFGLSSLLGALSPFVALILAGTAFLAIPGGGPDRLAAAAHLAAFVSTLVLGPIGALLGSAIGAGGPRTRPFILGGGTGALGLALIRPEPVLAAPLAIGAFLWPPALAGGVAAWLMTKEAHGTA